MQISIGRMVHYRLTRQDAINVNKRRQDALNALRAGVEDGVQIHYGRQALEGDLYPMVVTRVWTEEDLVNGKVLLDGNDDLWVTRISEVPVAAENFETVLGHWTWPPRG